MRTRERAVQRHERLPGERPWVEDGAVLLLAARARHVAAVRAAEHENARLVAADDELRLCLF